jgi:hypothetical protein
MKKSLLLYLDQKEVFDTLSDVQAGILIKAIFQYEFDKTLSELDPFLKIIFIPIRQAIDRNTERYDNVCKRNFENIGKRWNKNNTKNTSGKSGKNKIPTDTRNTNSDSNSDSDRNKDSNRNKEIIHVPDFLKGKWEEWEIFRKEKKKALTPSTIKKQINFLTVHKDHASEIIDQSILNGWIGLFELSENGQPVNHSFTPKDDDKW